MGPVVPAEAGPDPAVRNRRPVDCQPGPTWRRPPLRSRDRPGLRRAKSKVRSRGLHHHAAHGACLPPLRRVLPVSCAAVCSSRARTSLVFESAAVSAYHVSYLASFFGSHGTGVSIMGVFLSVSDTPSPFTPLLNPFLLANLDEVYDCVRIFENCGTGSWPASRLEELGKNWGAQTQRKLQIPGKLCRPSGSAPLRRADEGQRVPPRGWGRRPAKQPGPWREGGEEGASTQTAAAARERACFRHGLPVEAGEV